MRDGPEIIIIIKRNDTVPGDRNDFWDETGLDLNVDNFRLKILNELVEFSHEKKNKIVQFGFRVSQRPRDHIRFNITSPFFFVQP